MDQGTTQSARQEPASANLAVHDPYLDALEYLAGHHRLPFSRADITNNLPLEDGHLNTALFCRAAKRIGLNTKVVARKPSSVSPIACPYVVPLATGEVAIATRKLARRKTRIVVPGTPVSEDYRVPFDFTGTLEKLRIDITEQQLTDAQVRQYREGRVRAALSR